MVQARTPIRGRGGGERDLFVTIFVAYGSLIYHHLSQSWRRLCCCTPLNERWHKVKSNEHEQDGIRPSYQSAVWFQAVSENCYQSVPGRKKNEATTGHWKTGCCVFVVNNVATPGQEISWRFSIKINQLILKHVKITLHLRYQWIVVLLTLLRFTNNKLLKWCASPIICLSCSYITRIISCSWLCIAHNQERLPNTTYASTGVTAQSGGLIIII